MTLQKSNIVVGKTVPAGLLDRESAPLALTEALQAARKYIDSQRQLMETIIEQATDTQIQLALGQVRISRAMYESARPFEEGSQSAVRSTSIETSLRYVESVAEISSNERLIIEWIKSADRPATTAIDRYVDETLEIHVDPRFDIFVVSGSDASAITAALHARDCKRVLSWEDLRDSSTGSVARVDVIRTDAALLKLPDLMKCPAQRVWCLWGPDEQCPQGIKDSLYERLRKVMINGNTITALSSSWARHFIKNLPSLVHQGRDMQALQGALKGSGAIVIGAGPSLDESADWIKAQKPKPVIICAYKALKALARHQITPDFVVMLDPNQKVRHLEGVDLRGISAFVVEVSVCPEVLSRVDRPILPYSAGDGTSILFGIFGKRSPPIIPTGGSVLHAELQLAKFLGCDHVTLVGADFGFPRNRLYADGSGTGDTLSLSEDQKSFTRKPLDGEMRTGMLVKVVANDGTDMYASLELDAYRLWVEQFIRDWHREVPVRVFNVASKGARIEGAEFVALDAHRVTPASAGPQSLTESVTPLFDQARIRGSLSETLRKKMKKLRSLQKACTRAIEEVRKNPASDLSPYGSVVKLASACPEVSLLLAKQLQDINDQSTRSTIDVPTRLLNLIRNAGDQAQELAKLYGDVSESIFRSNRR